MSRFIETIKIENGNLCNRSFHNERFNRTLYSHYPNISNIEIGEQIKIPSFLNQGIYKCRVLYSDKINKIEFSEYIPKFISTLKIIRNDDIEYGFKYSDRDLINKLFQQRDECDDILIIKKGLIGDTSTGNIIFKSNNQWFTPKSSLLKGTQRARLIEEKKVNEIEISISELSKYQHFKIINAFSTFEDSLELPVTNIYF